MPNSKTGLAEKFAGHRWNKPVVWDVLFVLVLPVTCLVLDPGVLRIGPAPFHSEMFAEYQSPAYVLIGILIAGFWATFLPKLPSLAKSFLRGALILGFLVSVGFAVILVPFIPAAFFIYPTLAAFGFVPPFTAYRYFRRFRTLKKLEAGQQSGGGPAMAGFLAPLAIAAVLHIGILVSLEASFEDLSASDYEVRLMALERLASHPLCQAACRRRVVMLYCGDEIAVPRDSFIPLFLHNSGRTIRSDGTCYFD
jgi:hypothetical protein